MSDAKRPDNDPSMDDILASIRKIISDDEARAQAAARNDSSSTASEESDVSHGSRSALAAAREDVLLLTDLIEEPKIVAAPARPVPAAVPLPRIDPVKASEMPQPTVDPTPVPPTPAPDATLIGNAVAGATSTAFERLNQAVKQNVPNPVPVDPGPAVGASGKTIEDLVREMLRPMLKEWIDKNLPPMVERLVEREIARLTRG